MQQSQSQRERAVSAFQSNSRLQNQKTSGTIKKKNVKKN
jgi:hypothetical protein